MDTETRAWQSHLATAAVITVVVPVVTRLIDDEPSVLATTLLGAALAVCLWLMLFSGAAGKVGIHKARVPARDYQLAAVIALLLGGVLVAMAGYLFWPAAFIMGGVVGSFSSISESRESA
ncbi:hypothetical protein [Demetria terragena]|uniref:hypothetical protein n=1 Tax=Demetria terragena TaxID=63959 RepID=UPI00036AF0CF|nr:hypothetical protein [Demetria terragena]